MEDKGYHYFCKGNEKFDNNEIEEAISYYTKSVEIAPHFKTYEKLFDCYKKLSNDSLAEEFIKKAYDNNIKNDKIAYLYSQVLIENKNIIKAKQVLLNILERNPDYKKARDLLNNLS